MVILTVNTGVTREQVMAAMPAETCQTVQLYSNGKIRESYSRGDGRGVVLILNKDATQAQAIMDGPPWPTKRQFLSASDDRETHMENR